MMDNPRQLRLVLLLVSLVLLVNAGGCHRSCTQSIAVIPQISGTPLWEPENVGAQLAAAEVGERIYWNAATREDDVDGQIALVEKVVAKRYLGLILAPDHSLALIAPVRRALERGLPIVIVGSPMPIPPSSNICYVINDEEEGGRLAAQRVAGLTHGKGEVAVMGIDPDLAGLVLRANSFENFLSRNYPDIRIIVRRQGTLNFEHEQEEAEEVLRQNPGLNVIVALTSAATRGALSTIENSRRNAAVKVIGFEPDSLAFDNASLDSLIVQNTRAMGDRAVRLIHARLQGQPLPARIVLKPLLVTRENADSKTIQDLVYARWQPGATPLQRSFQQ